MKSTIKDTFEHLREFVTEEKRKLKKATSDPFKLCRKDLLQVK